MVVQPEQSTALHIACHFASLKGVFSLKRGADANVTDWFGRHHVTRSMVQSCRELEANVIGTLHYLARNGASPDIRAREGETACEKLGAGGSQPVLLFSVQPNRSFPSIMLSRRWLDSSPYLSCWQIEPAAVIVGHGSIETYLSGKFTLVSSILRKLRPHPYLWRPSALAFRSSTLVEPWALASRDFRFWFWVLRCRT